jgi:hemerythrin
MQSSVFWLTPGLNSAKGDTKPRILAMEVVAAKGTRMELKWDKHLSIGVPEIDQQHKSLIDKFNAFITACEEERGNDEVYRLFSFLDIYVKTHFVDEERLMQRIGYPDYMKHREKHQEFIGKVASFKERLNNEGPTQQLVASAGLLMTGWLIEHISGMDRAIGRFKNEHGK